MLGLNDLEFQEFFEGIAASTIANQALLKCSLSGIPLTSDNVILFVGDFFDPHLPQFSSLVVKIGVAIDEIIALRMR